MTARLLALLLIAGCGQKLPDVSDPCNEPIPAGDYRLVVGADRNRRVTVVVPPNLPVGRQTAVLAMHGGSGSKRKMRDITQLDATAAEHGLIAVYPNGSGTLGIDRTWNAGTCCGRAEAADLDDVAFLDAIVDELQDSMCVDRVLAAGFSNGGMMAMRWACEGGKLDALVTSGAVFLPDACPDGRPVPALVMHGGRDGVVPLAGGFGGANPVSVPPFTTTIARMSKLNACSVAPPLETANLPVTCQTFDCEASTTFCIIDKWGHQWPGGSNFVPPTGYDLTSEMIRWFNEVSPIE